MGNMKEDDGKKYLMVKDYVIDKVLDRTSKIIGIEKFDNIKILIDRDDILSSDITFKNTVVLMTSAIKDYGKFYP